MASKWDGYTDKKVYVLDTLGIKTTARNRDIAKTIEDKFDIPFSPTPNGYKSSVLAAYDHITQVLEQQGVCPRCGHQPDAKPVPPSGFIQRLTDWIDGLFKG